MLSTEDKLYIIDTLRGSDRSLKINLIKELWSFPVDDPAVLECIEESLNDSSLCIFAFPYQISELRWLAAQAYLTMCNTVCLSMFPDKPVTRRVSMEKVIIPISPSEVERLVRSCGLLMRPGIEGFLEAAQTLRELDVLPTTNVTLDSGDYRIDCNGQREIAATV